ncbi:MAG: hypothetical protein FWC20_10535 [Oscillospiraceae bacterium]|nr:hypothetical protein [Oscillospiraceae bacterium]MCL2279825.1 hypothetical protein [Oscillospiraceae bacterium]
MLWDITDTPMIIDWESAGYVNPGLELLDVSLFWSGGHKGLPDERAFNCFFSSYSENGGNLPASFNDIIYARFKNKLEWLEYNLKCALGIEFSDIIEQSKGSKRVLKAIDSIMVYLEIIPALERRLEKS